MYMTSTTSEIYAASGIGARTGWGSRPALLLVDLQTGFTDPKSGVGGELGDVVDATARLISGFRHRGLPVMFTAVGFQEGEPSNWLRKMPGLAVLREGGLGARSTRGLVGSSASHSGSNGLRRRSSARRCRRT